MPRRTLGSLGAMVRERRGTRKLREVAQEIGIGPATLMRVENGRIPDLTTFAKICRWLNVEPGSFLGFEPRESPSSASEAEPSRTLLVSAHLRADPTPKLETVQALAKMILFAARKQPTSQGDSEDAGV